MMRPCFIQVLASECRYDCDRWNKGSNGVRRLMVGGGADHPDGEIGAFDLAWAGDSSGLWYIGACL